MRLHQMKGWAAPHFASRYNKNQLLSPYTQGSCAVKVWCNTMTKSLGHKMRSCIYIYLHLYLAVIITYGADREKWVDKEKCIYMKGGREGMDESFPSPFSIQSIYQWQLFCREPAQSMADIRIFSSSKISKIYACIWCVCIMCVCLCIHTHTYIQFLSSITP